MQFRFSRRFRIHLVVIILAAVLQACGGEADSPASDQAQQASGPTEAATSAPRKRILFFGDSITAGYGLDPDKAFPALIQARIDELGWPFEAVNAGLSGETTAGGLRRIDWMLKQPVDVLVLELGGNDGLRGVPVSATKENLLEIVGKVKEAYPDAPIVIAGMRMPPNLGQTYAKSFAKVYPEVAKKTGSTLIPFIGEGVAGHDRLVQMDGIHPTAAGHEVVAETVWQYLEPILRDQMQDPA